jgi:hypothetical protein
MATKIQLRGGTAAQWTAANPILSEREVGIETDTRKFKFGDGVTAWNSLAYASSDSTGGAWGEITGTLSDQTDLQSALDLKADKEDFATLVDGATVTWNTDSAMFPEAKLTSTQSFTLNMTNVVSGAQGVLKLITNTASAITITFDNDFTNKVLGTLGEEAFTTFTFPAATAKEYLLSFVVDETTIHWSILANKLETSFSSVITGFSGTPTQSCSYSIIGNLCYLRMFITGTSNATSFTFTLPFTPAIAIVIPTIVDNVGTGALGRINTSGNVATVYATAAAGGFTASGTKSLYLSTVFAI